MRIFAPLVCLVLLTGCSSDIATLRDLKPVADDFNGALASEYLDFATSESELGHDSVARHFAAKGLRSFHGVDVAPDALDDGIDGTSAAELAEARSQLVSLLNAEVKNAAPQELARSQLLFDCWQQQVVDAIPEEKALCKAEFSPTLNQVLETAGSQVYGERFRRSIVFEAGVVKLNEGHMLDINDAMCMFSDHTDYWVELRAYVGKKNSQRKLTEARINAVKKALLKAGVAPRKIRIKREGGKGVFLSRDNIPANTKVVTITIAAEADGKKSK